VDRSGYLVALAGLQPEGLSLNVGTSERSSLIGQTLKDHKGTRYHQISLSLHTQDNLPWGYIQVGRSLKDFDDYLSAVQLILLLGLLVAMLLSC